jgi:Flp pilus assembly protein TadG
MRILARRERGAALVEMALVLPVLVLLIVGLFEFGRAYNAKITLTHATREGVRVYSISGDPDDAVSTVLSAAIPLDTSLINVTTTDCDRGEPTSVSATYPHSYNIPLFGAATINLSSTAVMRCGG